jgi:hypothetical protein
MQWPAAAMRRCLGSENLASAIGDNGGSDVIYVANPAQAASTRLRLGRLGHAVTIWSTPARAAGSVVAIAECFCLRL